MLYLILGAAAGLFAGLFGIGGGIILVPFLSWIYSSQGMTSNLVMLAAIATSLATIIPTSISSVNTHHKHGAVKWDIVLKLAPAILAGSLIGTVIAQQLETRVLKMVFGVFLILVSWQIGFQIKPAKQSWILGNGLGALAGAGIGALSSLLGIGGGTLTVPFLMKCRQPIRNAVAISSACGFPIAVAGSIGYVILGWNIPDRPAWSLGYIYGPAFIGIALSSIVFAPLGARLTHSLPTTRLKRLFAVFIFIVGCKLLL
ncbi:MAG: sulfite exporter TauE/SafE family protein [Methylococcaceae bacterium]|nr:sulfite exporter TauE/SafE family protein [Methylococcaceae bacterium]